MTAAVAFQLAAEPAPRSGARLLVSTLERLGVEVVFGYPGGAIMPVYDALTGSSLRHILVRHEQAAAFAADAWARRSGKIGVCLATSGPGATNLITGIANAMMDSIPIVCITGNVAQAVAVGLEDAATCFDTFTQNLKLSATDTRQDVRHTVVEADLAVLIVRGRIAGLSGQEACLSDQRLVVGHQHSAARGGDDLVAVERIDANAAEAAAGAALVQGAQ